MGWLQVIVAILGLAREVIKYISTIEETKKEKSQRIVAIKNGLRKARKENDTTDIESALAGIGIKLSNDKKE